MLLVLANASPSTPSWILLGASVAWAALWINLSVVPFFFKGETLYQDYSASGRLNASLASIESSQVIPALAKMFVQAAQAQHDKRKRPEHEIVELLNSVEFLPHLKDAQKAMGEMESLKLQYKKLRQCSKRIWQFGLAHSLLTPAICLLCMLLIPHWAYGTWVVTALSVVWLVALVLSASSFWRFHGLAHHFTAALDVDGGS
ncbi:MAG: hypothetical protein R3E01_13565 [Pirellulaceae bacterium]|nr:hypothetical protein [Bdellovibrionales bacterium]